MERGMEGEKERVVEKRKIRGGWRVTGRRKEGEKANIREKIKRDEER